MADEFFRMPKNVQTRWASAENFGALKGSGGTAVGGRKGSPSFVLKNSETAVLAEVKRTSGTVRRIWITIPDRSPASLRGIRLDMYWDGCPRPAVSAPLGDFFCQGLGRCVRFQSGLFSNPEGRSFNSCVPMPFRKAMKITATNESGMDVPMFFYDVDFTVGDRHPADVLYFHACWRREKRTSYQKDFTFMPYVEGRGRYMGEIFSVIANKALYFDSWWGEGEAKFFIDGDSERPTLCGTGTEDYIGTGWGLGVYDNLYQGSPVADFENFQFAFYRQHIPDPVYFHMNIKGEMQQIGCWSPENIKPLRDSGRSLQQNQPGKVPVDFAKAVEAKGYGLFERENDDWACCSWFYLDRPENGLQPLAPAGERIAGLVRSADASGRKDA